MKKSDKRWRQSVHEAGHAVVGVALGCKFINIVRYHGKHARTHLGVPTRNGAINEPDPVILAVMTAAGAAASFEYFGFSEGHQSDFHHNRLIGLKRVSLDLCGELARRMVRENRSAITTVARAFYKTDLLTKKAFNSLIVRKTR